ncbi:hypothetical protein DAI22_02g145800 [Oryza sativa Japonica Group]|nr:hypothetical protein DAI22_02g145800 [Oryza sativa Japonica Group]KAF2944480.1 hypothetical protein DAI22_02g145800 [Oryza sativa Japonica Group]KAF2944481.1 hypothetical protein DAI22_02g145800 [Oryza sativa Japonica Group]KAF2944482.1 hypothetical protein DAI22_02g145800 [Oryza sativa Japonica Group]
MPTTPPSSSYLFFLVLPFSPSRLTLSQCRRFLGSAGDAAALPSAGYRAPLRRPLKQMSRSRESVYWLHASLPLS